MAFQRTLRPAELRSNWIQGFRPPWGGGDEAAGSRTLRPPPPPKQRKISIDHRGLLPAVALIHSLCNDLYWLKEFCMI